MMIIKKVLPILFLSSTLLISCATSKKVEVVQVGDGNLTCSELTAELKKLDDAQAEVDSNKGVTGVNVASALFWIPGLAYTYYDAGQATEMISERKSHLTRLYNQKNC